MTCILEKSVTTVQTRILQVAYILCMKNIPRYIRKDYKKPYFINKGTTILQILRQYYCKNLDIQISVKT